MSILYTIIKDRDYNTISCNILLPCSLNVHVVTIWAMLNKDSHYYNKSRLLQTYQIPLWLPHGICWVTPLVPDFNFLLFNITNLQPVVKYPQLSDEYQAYLTFRLQMEMLRMNIINISSDSGRWWSMDKVIHIGQATNLKKKNETIPTYIMSHIPVPCWWNHASRQSCQLLSGCLWFPQPSY